MACGYCRCITPCARYEREQAEAAQLELEEAATRTDRALQDEEELETELLLVSAGIIPSWAPTLEDIEEMDRAVGWP